jgi:hypothetical protein
MEEMESYKTNDDYKVVERRNGFSIRFFKEGGL